MEIYFKNNEIYYTDQEVEGESGQYYDLDERLGAGGNGVVYKCISQDGTEYAVKILMHKTNKSTQRFAQEVELMRKVSNDHVIRYVDKGEIHLRTAGKGFNAPFVIMELAEQNLLDYIKENSQLTYEAYVPQFRGLCEGLKEIHKYAVHRDIKPENILIKGEKWILSDFGLCDFLAQDEKQDITRPNEKVGPIYWISPEAVNYAVFNKDEIGTWSDVYQLGLVFAFVLLRRYPGGVFSESETLNTTMPIKKVVFDSISNNYIRRPKNGAALLEAFNSATINA